MIDDNIRTECAWKERRAGNLYQCMARATMTVDLGGQLIPVCPYHGKRINRISVMRDNHVENIQKLDDQQREILNLISEVK